LPGRRRNKRSVNKKGEAKMDFNLNDLNPGAEFFFDEKDKSKGSVTLRACPPDAMKKITKITDSIKIKYHRGQRHEVAKRDEKKFDKLFWDYVILDWQGVTDNGKPLKCNVANKVKLVCGSVVFAEFVADSLEQLGFDQVEKNKAAEKN
jgi:hypothetical protein